MIVYQAWMVATIFLVVVLYLYAEEASNLLDWASWNAATLVMRVRLFFWKMWLGPRLKIETYFRMRQARARQTKYNRSSQEIDS